MTPRHSPLEALWMAQAGQLEEWVHAFLWAEGGNLALSKGLRLQPRFWSGPVRVPLGLLERCYGPEPGMEFVADPASWEQRVGRMQSSLASGWMPPPLIAQFLPTGAFSLRDGNHRHEALRRAGAGDWWCAIWSDSEQLKQQADGLLAERRTQA